MRQLQLPGLFLQINLLPAVAGALAAGVAMMAAAVATQSPAGALLTTGILLSGLLLYLGDRLPGLFLGCLGVLLFGYAFLGRGLAHVGVAPVYVGELVLGIGCLSIIATAHRLRIGVLEALLLAFIALGAVRTVPYIDEYGLDAPRDGILWGYGLIALAVLLALQQIRRPDAVVQQYGKVLVPFLVWAPLAAMVVRTWPGLVPPGPGSDVSLLVFKGGDFAVHLAGAAAFVILGLYAPMTRVRLLDWLLWPVWLAGIAIPAFTNRAGLLAVSLSLLLLFLFRPSPRVMMIVALGALALALAALLGVRADTDAQREISPEQFASNARSIVSDDERGLQGTKDFRLEWWGEIVSYTFGGPYFWSGKGFGVNLADSDGFQILHDRSLRAPHNSHLTVLARMGVPGFVLWIALQAAFAGSLFLAWVRASRSGHTAWASIDVWLLVYWLAMTVNAAFDPYLEGPQGGIWFWSLLGFGLYALQAQRSLPEPGLNRAPARWGRLATRSPTRTTADA